MPTFKPRHTATKVVKAVRFPGTPIEKIAEFVNAVPGHAIEILYYRPDIPELGLNLHLVPLLKMRGGAYLTAEGGTLAVHTPEEFNAAYPGNSLHYPNGLIHRHVRVPEDPSSYVEAAAYDGVHLDPILAIYGDRLDSFLFDYTATPRTLSVVPRVGQVLCLREGDYVTRIGGKLGMMRGETFDAAYIPVDA